jgi:hypothetical protein
VRLDGFGQLKNPMTSPAIEPVTFQLVAQCLNQPRYRMWPNARYTVLSRQTSGDTEENNEELQSEEPGFGAKIENRNLKNKNVTLSKHNVRCRESNPTPPPPNQVTLQ